MVIIPSKGRSTTIRTHKLFPNAKIVVHNEIEAASYRANPHLSNEIIVSNTPLGVSYQRQWIIDNLVPRGEWFVTADDNIEYCTAVPKLSYEAGKCDDRDQFASVSSLEYMNWVISDTIAEADKIGANYCGFAVVDNYYFRTKKFRYVGYVISKLAMIKNVGVPYDSRIQAMDDYGYTAENLLRYGKVLINNFLFPIAKHYEAGGIGTYEERMPKKQHDCRYLMMKYPELFRYKTKAGCDPKSEIQVRFTTLKQVADWRKKMFASGGRI